MRRDIEKLLRDNPYPGRGIIIGMDGAGKHMIIIYFIMGRSENSRNRIFEKTSDGIRTAAHDESKLTDPSLVIYHPLRSVKTDGGVLTVVTNGDQTDTIRDLLAQGKSPVEALMTRKYEPDAPNYTPRISGVLFPGGGYMLSILKAQEQKDICCERFFYCYDLPQPGLGHFISTYETDGSPLPPFCGEPVPIDLTGFNDLEGFANKVWNVLDENNKVSLYARSMRKETGEIEELIINKHT